MKRLLDYIRGVCRLKIKGVEPERCMNRFLQAGIPFWNTRKTGELTLELFLYDKDAGRAIALCSRCQCDGECVRLHSLKRDFYGLKGRWALLLGIVGVIAGLIYLPNFIIAVEVEGCDSQMATEIVHALEDYGIGFGTRGSSVDSALLRNEMLLRFPKLRWFSVNCHGLRATVQVAERRESEPVESRLGSASLVACADGMVTELSVLNGQALCAPGEGVLAGQTLISGAVDLERVTVLTRAMGEVYGDTRRVMQVKTTAKRTQNEVSGVAGRCLYLCLGRKRIKIFGNSGILLSQCVKIKKDYTMTLPGNITLPVSVTVVTYYETKGQTVSLSRTRGLQILTDYFTRWRKENLVAGRLLSVKNELHGFSGQYTLIQTMYCHEMLARSMEIPILETTQDGENNQCGENRTAH